MGLLCTTCHKVETTLNMQREITENRKEKKKNSWPKPQTSLMVQWMGIWVPIQGTGSWSEKIPHAVEHLRLGPTTAEARALETTLCNKQATAVRSLCTATRSSPRSPKFEKARSHNKDPVQRKKTLTSDLHSTRNVKRSFICVQVTVILCCLTMCNPWALENVDSRNWNEL